jgi:cytochrome b
MKTRILVWDLPTRVFHWSLASSFAVAFLTAESERWRDIHVVAGYVLLGLVAFRLVWGLIGSRYARFSEFVQGPRHVALYLKSVMRGRPTHHAGHNPAGGVAIITLIGLGVLSGASGWLLYEEVGGDLMEEVHEIVSYAMLVVVFMHIAGVLIASRLHRENLVWAMVTGMKQGDPGEAIPTSSRPTAWLLIAGLAASLTWAAYGMQLASTDQASSSIEGERAGEDDEDQDDD